MPTGRCLRDLNHHFQSPQRSSAGLSWFAPTGAGFLIIVCRERGGQGWLSGADRLVRVRPGKLRIAGWACDAMTGKKGINKFDQTFHRGSSIDIYETGQARSRRELMNPPEGNVWRGQTEGTSPLASICFSIHYGGMVSVTGETQDPSLRSGFRQRTNAR